MHSCAQKARECAGEEDQEIVRNALKGQATKHVAELLCKARQKRNLDDAPEEESSRSKTSKGQL